MTSLDMHHPGLHELIAPDAPITRIAGGLGFTEGPVWRGTFPALQRHSQQAHRALAPPPGRPGADHLCHGKLQWPDSGPPGSGAGGGA